MLNQRGSTTVMAIIAMLVLAASATSVAYVTQRNVTIVKNYADGLKAQYAAEAAVKLMYVSGSESMKTENLWTSSMPSTLKEWADAGKPVNISFPWGTSAVVTVSPSAASSSKFKIFAVGTVSMANGTQSISRIAYNDGMDIVNQNTSTTQDKITPKSPGDLINSADTHVWLSDGNYKWTVPYPNDSTKPAYSPGAREGTWSGLRSQMLFNDVLGLDSFNATDKLQLVFKINYYLRLTDVPGSGSGSGYGIYYLAQKNSVTSNGVTTWSAGNAANPTAYVVQYDPGLNPTYNVGGNNPFNASDVWGASYSTQANNWPYGAFLVKKVVNDGSDGAQNEVWDESATYYDHFAFQDNNELTQSPTLVTNPNTNIPHSSQPSLSTVPTTFGSSLIGKYRYRPPDLRIPFLLGYIAEGNPRQNNTYYPQNAKIAVGLWLDTPIDILEEKRMVWVAQNAGTTDKSKPSAMNTYPSEGTIVQDGQVKWKAVKAPTSEEIANTIKSTGISIAKIAMCDLKFRLDSVTGTNQLTTPYGVPFSMVKGNQNKISIELWADISGNRIHLIRVNDVLVLAFNDLSQYDETDKTHKKYEHDIVPDNWEKKPSAYQLGTGLRVWNAAAEFYMSDCYGQQVVTTTTTVPNYGMWGR